MKCKGWRPSLFAFLLAASLAEVSGDLNDVVDDPSLDSRSGNPTDFDIENNDNEPKADNEEVEAFVDNLAKFGVPEYPDDDSRRKTRLQSWNHPDWIDKHDPLYIMENQDGNLLPGLSVNSPQYRFPVLKTDVNDAEQKPYYAHRPNYGNQAKQKWADDPIFVIENSGHGIQFPKPSGNLQGTYPMQGHSDHDFNFRGFRDDQESSLIKDQFIGAAPEISEDQDELISEDPMYETVLLNNEYRYDSKNNSELGSSLITPNKFHSKLIPFDKHVLLNDIPGAENIIICAQEGEIHNFWAPGFQCMVCVCLAAYGNLRPACVSCQSCLTPPEPTTHRPTIPPYTPPPTPPPPPEDVSCKPLPVNVPFPSPIDPCKVCVCSETFNQWGKLDVKINCQHNPQCVLPTTPRPHISTPVPLPVCDKFPPNVLFPHPHDYCRICQCIVTRTPSGQLERRIDCYANPECQPTTSTQPPEPITDLPTPEICDHHPENVLFPHPRDQCQMCKCTGHSGLFFDRRKITCYIQPNCNPTIEPVTITPAPPPEPQPKPANVTCAPLPTDRPFQHPLHPCQICTCTERLNLYAEMEAIIDCKENPQCVLPPDFTTVSPEIHNHTKVPACKNFPANVYFPHPADPCQLCKCTVVQSGPYSPPEQLMSCIVKPECLPPTLPPPLPPSSSVRPPNPDPLHLCEKYPENYIFPDPMDRCRLCKCYKDPRSNFKSMVSCFLNPECEVTSRSPPITTVEPEPEIVSCAPLPANTPFPSPVNPCQICICTERADFFGRHTVNVECKENPQCVLPPNEPTIPPVIVIPIRWPACKNFPLDVSFPHPRDLCQRCKCSIMHDSFGKPGQHLSCSLIPECVPPSTTEHTVPIDVCERYPINTPFDDPNDQCRTCTCTQIGSAAPTDGLRNPLYPPQLQILCQIKPECLPSPTTERPVPYDICVRYPINTPFDDPNDQCRTCTCTQIGNASPADGLRNPLYPPQLQILCQIKPECLPPPTTERPVPYDVCGRFPINTPFDDPTDRCRTCTCTQIGNAAPTAGLQNPLYPTQLQIICQIKPECLPPSTTQHPVPYDICERYPINTPFDDPNDRCRTCTCTQIGNAAPTDGLRNPLYPQQLQILCQIKPECLPPPTTEQPVPYDVCGRYPVNTPFDDPNDQCRTCMCTQIGNAAPTAGLQNPLYPSQLQILCQIKPECLPTEKPEPNSICDYRNVDVPFDDPRDPCRSCVCYWDSPGSAPSQGLSHPLPAKLFKCIVKPECLPTPPPITVEPEPYSMCANVPVDVPFTDPNDQCQTCVCYWSSAGAAPGSVALSEALGHPAPGQVKLYRCVLKPECHRPIPEPLTKAPPIDVSCKPLPSGIPFESPLNPCQVCTCTETIDAYGRPDVIFKCQQNPQCVVPHDVTTVPPDSHTSPVPLPACAQFPTNVVFPHPSDPCKLCKCTVERTPWGQPEQLINCFTNPDCATPPTTIAPVPWPPAPPGPLPGPSPHESCAPYISNQPFQHPWDECQVCVCKEAISSERITIEVNCYTKPSCCYEPPYDIPGLPSPGFPSPGLPNPGIISSGYPSLGSMNPGFPSPGLSSSELPDGGAVVVDIGPLTDEDSSNWDKTETGSNSHIINLKHAIGGTAGGNLFEHSGGNLIHSSGGNMIGVGGDNMYKHKGGIQTYVPNGIDFNGAGASNIRGEKWIAVQGGNIIGPRLGSNIVGSTGGHVIRPTSGNLIRPFGGNSIGPNGANRYEPNGAIYYGMNDGKYRPNDRNLFGSNGRNLYRQAGTNLIASNLQPLLKPNGNLYVPNRENVLVRAKGDASGDGLAWKQNYHYNLRTDDLAETKTEALSNGLKNNVAAFVPHQYKSSKMKTKSGRPSDNDDSEDYD